MKYKNLFIIMFAALLASSFTSQNTQKADVRSLEKFTDISINGAFYVELVQSNEHSIDIDAEQDIKDRIITRVVNGELKISSTDQYKSLKRVRLTISLKNLERLKIAGANNIKTQDKMSLDNVLILSSGASKVFLDVEANSIEAKSSGTCNTTLAGSTHLLSCKMSGVSKLNAFELESSEVELSISGACAAEVNSTEKLDVKCAGTSKVTYKGNPHNVNKKISGISRVKNI